MSGIRVCPTLVLAIGLANCLPHMRLVAQDAAAEQSASNADAQLDQLKVEFRQELVKLRRAYAAARNDDDQTAIVTSGGVLLDRAVEALMRDMGHEVELVRRYRKDQ